MPENACGLCRAGSNVGMIDSLLNLLFRCSHRHLTRPMAPRSGPGPNTQAEAYVVCLDCGKRFMYDLKEMRFKPVAEDSLPA
jgi:hypothetical protein